LKKILLVATLLLCVVGLTGCNKYRTYTELSFKELQNKIDNKDSFVLVIGSNSCSACAIYKKTMEQVIKDKQVEIFYLDNDKLTEDESSKIYSKYVITGTPTTIFIENGVETSTYDRLYNVGYNDVVNKLKKYGIIGE